jgi:hypothetical protein
VRILNGLMFAGFLPLFLRIFWHNQVLLIISLVIVFPSFFYMGLLMIFGSQSTVLNLWVPRIKRKWLQGQSDDQLLFQIRVIGVALVAVMLYALYQIIHTKVAANTVQHLGR